MSNFEKELKDATDEELRCWMNKYDPRYGSLVSDELTRRSLQELRKTIQDLDRNTRNHSGSLIDLTILLFFVALMQIFISVISIPEPWLTKIFIFGGVVYMIYFITRLITKERNKKSNN